jgi:hypothetical protein
MAKRLGLFKGKKIKFLRCGKLYVGSIVKMYSDKAICLVDGDLIEVSYREMLEATKDR